ncbi:MAG TPA: hypothetical protein VKD22_03750 [Ramlibacter sp.]|nr:hypothetical protein [Ramlibacter sp.]
MLRPWLDAGFECHAVDIQHPPGKTTEGLLTRWGMDVREWARVFVEERPDAAVVFASFFPPCTDLAVSGARWFASKEAASPGTRARAMALVHWADEMGRRLACPYFIENPVSVISTEWRKYDHAFHPYEYGGYRGGENDGYTKKTCLWTGGGFVMPPGPERQNLRSQTPAGFARAVFEAHADPSK